MDVKPSLFVGSSSEGIEIARAVELQLSDTAEVTIWKDGPFGLNVGNLDALVRAADEYDFAVLVLTPDDLVTSRDVSLQAPRDNVMFELGLFMGRLGKERCFAMASDAGMKLPSDLAGVTLARYQSTRRDGNWRAAVGPASTLIRNEIKALGVRTKDEAVVRVEAAKPVFDVEEQDSLKTSLHRLGIKIDENVSFEALPEPLTAWFHNERFCDAFPGVRGIQRFEDVASAIQRLGILLREPLEWVVTDDGGNANGVKTPIWWWRGLSNNPVTKFFHLTDDVVLFDYQELRIKTVMAVNAGSYWQSFVYVETVASEPTGLYEYESGYIDDWFKKYGPYTEEYGEWNGTKITRAEYDDGAATINGQPVRTEDAKLRVRFLTPSNLILASQQSPINNGKFDGVFSKLMGNMLDGSASIEDLTKAFLNLPKRGND